MKTLANFPDDFLPLVAVTGDRREVPPQSKGDMLAYSVSSTDFMYINNLNLSKCLVVSDKQFVIDTKEDLKRRFDSTNILVIGSPAVNLFARQINDQSIFRFDISDETKKELKEQYDFMVKYIEFEDDLFVYHQCLDGIFNLDNILSRFAGLEPNIDLLREKAEIIISEFRKTSICSDLDNQPRPIRYLMHKLDRPGIYDSLAGISRGQAIPQFKDYGLITILKNPFSEDKDYYIIYVAGVHGPGTSLGVSMLSDRNAFKNHPFGGVFEVTIDRFSSYFEKIQNSNIRWETRAYKINGYPIETLTSKKEINAFLSSPAGKDDEQQMIFNGELKRILIEICSDMGFILNLEEPYTIPLGGSPDFWKEILKYQKNSKFIIHDITHRARGVMVEIGFSFGERRQHFLIWNMEKSPVKNWEEMQIPLLLPVENIEQINLNDLEKSTETLKQKIIKKALSETYTFDCDSCSMINKQINKKIAYIYSCESELTKYLVKELNERKIKIIEEDESQKEPRICKICQVLRVSDFAFLEIDDSDPNSFIVLGMSKAIGLKTFLLSLEKYEKKDFPWAVDINSYQIGRLPEQLDKRVAKFLKIYMLP